MKGAYVFQTINYAVGDRSGASTCVFAQADSSFVKDASEGGLAEVEIGQMAQEKGQSQAVKDFGARMVADHSKANDELKSIASREGLSIATSVGVKDEGLKLKLKALSGESFDKAYMSAMVDDHQKDVAAFQKEADSGTDPAVRSFAAKTLPTLKKHLAMAQKAAQEVGAK
jgi:putative membrane protein